LNLEFPHIVHWNIQNLTYKLAPKLEHALEGILRK
jgi:hypothetical protein